MLPSRSFLRKSLALWKRREDYRKRRHDYYQHLLDLARGRHETPPAKIVARRDKWSRLLFEARAEVARREQQLGVGPEVMFDATNIAAIPVDAHAVAGYVAGHWPTFPHLAERFPHARRVSIAVASTQDADCLDVEPLDSTPALAPGWVLRQHSRGVKRPIVYCSLATVSELTAQLSAAGIKRPAYRLWTAHYTGHAHVCGPACGFGMATVADATQWTSSSQGRDLDESRCAPSFWR